ncbi:MAG: helix-turn-helix domain-containing protein [Hydrogenophaga sp.]|jgi:hypothetical protein|uniref:helix-turn-helix domain-containing protein n=1 Tax=Hydrogenophaga sp. TaxID=1904254 RepID=UPI001D61AD8C|nr:helix-turn-helix domain-containing protein [Hydrogenophaga sp.]MBW0170735.1 helix-turn-helix domain-containing protein [Hydrogenophaga sp.]MBW0185591.1 helix-turn-helix domain-containing protein [Hydrogenophaga sp.]
MKNTSPEKAKGPTVAAVSPLKTGQSGRKFSPKSTHSEAQRQRILEALRHRPQTSYDLRRLGCYQAAARVKELRDRFGYVIRTERVTLYDRDGFMHPRAARYHLEAEPDGERAQ